MAYKPDNHLQEILQSLEKTKELKTFILRELKVSDTQKSRYIDFLEIAIGLSNSYALSDDQPLEVARQLFLSIKGPLLRSVSRTKIRAESGEWRELRQLKSFLQYTEEDSYMSPNLRMTRPLFERLCNNLIYPINAMIYEKNVETLREGLN